MYKVVCVLGGSIVLPEALQAPTNTKRPANYSAWNTEQSKLAFDYSADKKVLPGLSYCMVRKKTTFSLITNDEKVPSNQR